MLLPNVQIGVTIPGLVEKMWKEVNKHGKR